MIRPTTYTIFLSRPSDVESDIEVVKDAISDVNFIAEPLGVHFVTFDWRENATPGLAVEPQARISAQSHGYDVIIALLGATLGTPTIHHQSGSVEEIEGAIEGAPSSVFGNDSVLIFFKEVALSLSSDLDAAKKVQELKKSLGPRGILYKQYGSDEDLRQGILRSIGVLIGSHINHGQNKVEISAPTPVVLEDKGDPVDEIDELGIMDYSQISAEYIQIATQAAERVGTAMRVLGEIASEKTPTITDAAASDDKVAMRKAISEVAGAMENCASQVKIEGEAMSDSFKKCLSAIRSVLDIQAVDLSADQSNSELIIAAQMTDDLIKTIDVVTEQIGEFRESITTLPRLTRELNQAKRRLLISVEGLIAMLIDISGELGAINSFARSSLGLSQGAPLSSS